MQLGNASDKERSPNDLSSLIEKILCAAAYSQRCCFWRGQANAEWKPYPGIYRRLIANGYAEEDICEELIAKYEIDLLCEANGLGFYGEAGATRLGFMINLQHFGGATRLLDVTRDPFVALWFSLQAHDDCDGVVFCYQIEPDYCPLPERVGSWDDVVSNCLVGRPFVLAPRKINDRIKAQQGHFLTTVVEKNLASGTAFTQSTDVSEIERITIPKALKPMLRKWIEVSRQARAVDFFPDFPGFAQTNSSTSVFPRSEESLYDGSDGLFPSAIDYGKGIFLDA